MTHSDKQKGTSKRPALRIVQSLSTEEVEKLQEEASSSSASTISSTSTEATSSIPDGRRTKAEREEFLEELAEFLDILLDAAHKDHITGVAFVTINNDETTTGTAYTLSCKHASHLTIAGIETLRYRFMRDFMDDE